jgi:hypothetical protein
LLAGCGGGSPIPTATATPSSTPLSTAPGTATTPAGSQLPVFPFSGSIPAGTYAWISFEPHLRLVIPDGWQVGHRHRDYFDVGLLAAPSGGESPGVGFGRFEAASGPNGPAPLVEAASVLDGFAANPAVKVTNRAPATLLGLSGLTARLSVSAPSTPIFDNEAGAFKLDPGWTVQCWFLDVADGVLFVGVFGHTGNEAADLEAARVILDGVSLAR